MRVGGAVAFDPIENASRDELTALQIQRLRWSLLHAYAHVPHYRKSFDGAGVHPDDLHVLADLGRFPFTRKQDLRGAFPFGMFAVPREQIRRVHVSSGTTGAATVVGYTAEDLRMWAEVMARTIHAAGGRPRMLVHNAYGYGLFTGGLGMHYGAERLGCAVIPASGGMTQRQAQLILDMRPDLLMATPSYALVIMDELRARGCAPGDISLSVGLFGAEPWTEQMRAELEQGFGIDALDNYGLSEVIGPGVSVECIESKDGLHIWEDHFYPEIIDPDTGEVQPEGAFGELVFTSLTKQAMPVIRYRTRDLSRLLPGTARTMRRMEKVRGRSDDMIVLRGVNVFPSQIEALILEDSRLTPHYVLELRRERRLDHLTVRVELRDGDGGEHDGAESLAHRIKTLLGVTVMVELAQPGSVERSAGKAKRFLDLREKS
jgi:phenylacetate-CoA ligase